MLSDLSFKSKIAAVFFVLAKLMSIPTAYLVITRHNNAVLFITAYSAMLMFSIFFAAPAKKSNDLEKRVKILIDSGKSFKIENGNITEIR